METRPAFYTTEFWITIATNVGILAAALTSNLSPRYAAIAAAVSVFGYSIARGLAKQGVAPDLTVPANTKLIPRRRHMRSSSR